MQSRFLRSSLTLAVLGLSGAAFAGDLEAAEKRIEESWGRLRSLSATMTVKTEVIAGEIKQTSEETGPYEFLRKGDKLLYRREVKHVMVSNASGAEERTEINRLYVCDGDHEYEFTDTNGQKYAKKRKATPEQLNPKTWIDAEKAANNTKLLTDEKVDGHDCWVIEATRKSGKPRRTVSYYAKDFGFKLKSVTYSPDGVQEESSTYTGVKVNEDLNPERFVFNPEGVQVEEYP